jgi:hypothetical protein
MNRSIDSVSVRNIREKILSDPNLPVFHDDETVAAMFGLSEAYNHAVQTLQYRQRRWPQSEWVLRFKMLYRDNIAFLLVPLGQVQSTERTMPQLTKNPAFSQVAKFHSESAYVVSVWEVVYNAYNAKDETYIATKQRLGVSNHNNSFCYVPGKHVTTADGQFTADQICGAGIHYFANLLTALTYSFTSGYGNRERGIIVSMGNELWTMTCCGSDTYFKHERLGFLQLAVTGNNISVYVSHEAYDGSYAYAYALSPEIACGLIYLLSIIRFGNIDALSGSIVCINAHKAFHLA